ncbi:DNA-binding protein [Escherichia coli]
MLSFLTLASARQRAPRQQQNGQRILHPPWRLRMRARRKRG